MDEAKFRKLELLSVVLAAAGALLLAAGIALLIVSIPAGAQEAAVISPGCHQAQRIVYARCGHELLRREEVPAAWVGMTRGRVEEALEAEGAWRLSGFSPEKLSLTQTRDLFCPAHWVLMMDENGATGIWRNLDGESLTLLEASSFQPTDEELRATLCSGLAFDSRQALEDALSRMQGAQ